MKAKKILFITQEIVPYVSSSQMAVAGREIPQSIQENGFEIRTFMPEWGNINERRNQLHEVIRLSGMNIIVDDSDHPLIIKVASIQPARMQVYFIDNDDYFHKRLMLKDANGNEYTDNIERAVFYARGVLETVKKLRWAPDVIHCHGWMSAIVPLYIKYAYKDEPTFKDTKIIFSAYDEMPEIAPAPNTVSAISFRSANAEVIQQSGIDLTKPEALAQIGICWADGFIQSGNNNELNEFAKSRGIPSVECPGDASSVKTIAEFYDTIYGDKEE